MPKKIYFSENLIANLLIQGEKALIKNVLAYIKSVNRLDGDEKIIRDYLTKEVD